MAYTACSENPFCKDPSLDNRDKELTQLHCLGSAMHFEPSSGCSFGTERVSSGMGKTNVASQEQRPPFFAEGTLTPVVVGPGMLQVLIVPKYASVYVYFI